LEIGGSPDLTEELILNVSGHANSEELPELGEFDFLSLSVIDYRQTYNEGEEEEEPAAYKLFRRDKDYTFRDYGIMGYYNMRDTSALVEVDGTVNITVPWYYLPDEENNPVIPPDTIKTDYVYGITFFGRREYSKIDTIRILKLTTDIDKEIRRDIQEIEGTVLFEELQRQKVIGLQVMYGSVEINFLLLVDDNTRTLLNKLIYIYTHISDFLKKKGITLKDVLEDVDLYVAIAAAAATAT
jgi:hypothetical protein